MASEDQKQSDSAEAAASGSAPPADGDGATDAAAKDAEAANAGAADEGAANEGAADEGAADEGAADEGAQEPEPADEPAAADDAHGGHGTAGSGGAPNGDDIDFSRAAPRLMTLAGGIGAVALLGAVGLGAAAGDGFKSFLHSYLTAFMFALSIGLGALWWVTLQHLVNAHWSTVVRRIGEMLASTMPLLAVLSLPIVLPVVAGNAALFPWADRAMMEADHHLQHKLPYLNATFFIIRIATYFGVWIALSTYLVRSSNQHDRSGDPKVLNTLRAVAAPGMIALAVTLTFAAFDLLMSLDPKWFSTIFGVYYFAGCVLAFHCVLALLAFYMQGSGLLKKSVSIHHFHDIGKMVFAFTVFWAYIGFSQFMLIWYANLPETTGFYLIRIKHGWEVLSYGLIALHFFVPFLGLLSKHVKRSRLGLTFWAIWMLVMHYVDLYWLVVPNLSPERVPFGPVDVLSVIGLVGLLIAAAAWQGRGWNLLPIRDPRLTKGLAFENY